MIQWLLKKWDERRRKIDLQILWPICKERAPDLNHAKAAFAVHAFNDIAWTRRLSRDEISWFITNELR